MNKTLMIGSALIITFIAFEGLATTTALPAVVEDLNGLSLFPIASGITLAAQVFTTLIAGSWADAKGPRQPFLSGLVLFSAGLLLCALSQDMFVFVLGRLIQGFGGGLLIVPLYVLAGYYLEPQQMPLFFTLFSASWVVPSLIGPAIAGWIAQTVSWHWVFSGPIPFVLFSAIPLFTLLSAMPHVKVPLGRKNVYRGLVGLLAGFLIALLQSISTFTGLTFSVLAVVGLVGSALIIPRILPRGTFSARRGVGTMTLARISSMAISGIGDYFMPLVLVRYWHWDLALAGVGLTIGSITWAIASFIQSRVKSPVYRPWLPFIGSIAIVIGVALMFGLGFKPWGVWVALLGWALVNLGNGFIMPTISVLALEITPTHRHGRISAYLQTADAVGPSWALGAIGVMFATTISLGDPMSFSPAIVIAVICALVCLIASYRVSKMP